MLSVAALRLENFRNYAAADLAFTPAPVVLIGPNGAGKTNLLEALTMLAAGRGLRGADLADLARHDAAERPRAWVVSAMLARDSGAGLLHTAAGAERTPEGGLKRLLRLDHQPATAAQLAAAAPMSWATPAMDRLFAGPPGDRRRFLDRLTFARAPEHGQVAAAYERALRERLRLLVEGGAAPAWLDALEAQIAAHGAALAAARVETLRLLIAEIAARPDGAFPKAELDLDGVLEARFAAGAPSAEVEEGFARALRDSRRRDAAAKRSLEGPHRSDLLVRHAEKAMPAALCSTGEQKALLLGLMLAHARAAGPALLLLDEAGAHLDAARRAALFAQTAALPGQVWLTGTEAAMFEGFEAAQMLSVSDGQVRPLN